jgi:putative polyhydroxyalkanoate system protein
MSKISITRSHNFEHDELVEHVEQLAGKLIQKFGGSYEWDGDDLVYDYSGGLNARVACTPQDVTVNIKLGMMMSMLKNTLAREVEKYMDDYIGTA